MKWSDEQFRECRWEDGTKFRKAMAAIGIKMMLLYGITYRELRKIRWDAYDELYGNIVINGVSSSPALQIICAVKANKNIL